MVEFKLKEAFVCNHCRQFCEGTCSKELEEIICGKRIDNDLYPRKQLIGCLGKYCDKPCKLQKEESDLTFEQCIKLIYYLGNKLNKELTKNKED